MPDRIRGTEQGYAYDYSQDRFIPPLRVTGVVVSQWITGDYFYRHNRSKFSMSLITAGSAVFTQRDVHGEVRCGEVFLAHQGVDQVLATGNDGLMQKITLLVDGPVLDTFLNACGLVQCDVVVPADTEHIISLFESACEIMRGKSAGFVSRLTIIAYEILTVLGQSITPQYPLPIRIAIDFIKRNLHRPLNLHELSAIAHVSVRHCTRLFQQHMQMSPMQFYYEQRMALARTMLANTSLSIKQISVAMGFEDPLYFSSRFRRHQGVSPKGFRRSLSIRK